MSNKIETPTINKYNVTPKFRKAKVGSDHDYICTVNSIESNSDIFFCGDKFLEEICLNHKDRLIKLVINDIKYVNTYNVEDKCKSIVYYVKNGIIHNLNGPATIGKFFDLSSQKEYYVNGFYIGLEGEPNVETSFKQEVKDYLKLNPKEREAFTTLKKNMTNKPAAKKPAAKKPAVANKSKTPILDSLCSNYTFNPSVEKGCDIECNIENFRIAKYNESDHALSNLNTEISSVYPGKNIKVIYNGLIGDIEPKRVSIVEHICDGEYHNAYGPAIYSINKNGNRFDGYYYEHGKEIGYCDRDEFPINGITSIIEDHGYRVIYTPAPENDGISYDYDILCEFSGLDMNELGVDYEEEDLNKEICRGLPNKRIKVVYKHIINDDDERTKVVDYLYNSELHRDNGPARYSVYSYGKKLNGAYYTHDKFVSYCDNNKYPIEGRLTEKKIEDKKVVKPTTIKSLSVPKYVQYVIDTNDIKYIEKEIKRINNLKSNKDKTVYIKTKNVNYTFFNGKLHDDKEAAIEIKDNSGKIISEEYYLDGKKAYFYNDKINKEPKKVKVKEMNKEKLPYYEVTEIINNFTGESKISRYFSKDNMILHNPNGPALISFRGNGVTEKKYFLNGKEAYYYNNAVVAKKDNLSTNKGFHTTVENKDYICYYDHINNQHNTGNPAIIYKENTESPYSSNKYWMRNGKKHRENGPAVVCGDGRREYWLDGIQFIKEKYDLKIKELYGDITGIEQANQVKSETFDTKPDTSSDVTVTQKVQEENKKLMASKEYKLFDADRWLAESKKAGIRVTANQITDFVSGALVGFIAKQFGDTPEIRLYAETVIKTKAGKALVSTVAGNVIPMIEQLNGNETATILAEEFRIQAMETIGNQLMSFVMAELVPGIAGIVSAIPAQIAPTSIQKEASGVKQLRVEHPEQAVEEESNVVPIAVKNAL